MASRRRGKGRRKVGRKSTDAEPDSPSQEVSEPPFESVAALSAYRRSNRRPGARAGLPGCFIAPEKKCVKTSSD